VALPVLLEPENDIFFNFPSRNYLCVLLGREGFFMAIYTRTGDKGKTSLFSGQRVLKSDLRIEVLGTIDELSSMIGVVVSEIRNPKSEIRKELLRIQNDLFEIGSNLASQGLTLEAQVSSQKLEVSSLTKRVKEFEDLIDKMTKQMPVLKNFILPGEGRNGAMLHLSRAVCRRLERRVVSLSEKQKVKSKKQTGLIIYLNRLSDLLFTMARFVNFKEKKKEIVWPTYAKASAGERGRK
jgi:cob(I)alamin adenosyltransferase